MLKKFIGIVTFLSLTCSAHADDSNNEATFAFGASLSINDESHVFKTSMFKPEEVHFNNNLSKTLCCIRSNVYRGVGTSQEEADDESDEVSMNITCVNRKTAEFISIATSCSTARSDLGSAHGSFVHKYKNEQGKLESLNIKLQLLCKSLVKSNKTDDSKKDL